MQNEPAAPHAYGQAAADERLPQKLIGNWCAELGSTEDLATYQRRGQCNDDQGGSSSSLISSQGTTRSRARSKRLRPQPRPRGTRSNSIAVSLMAKSGKTPAGCQSSKAGSSSRPQTRTALPRHGLAADRAQGNAIGWYELADLGRACCSNLALGRLAGLAGKRVGEGPWRRT
jgi:hypothetical protein